MYALYTALKLSCMNPCLDQMDYTGFGFSSLHSNSIEDTFSKNCATRTTAEAR